MTTITAPTTYTPEEVARLSDRDEKLYELSSGRLVEKPARTLLSNWVVGRVSFFLRLCYAPDKAYVIQEQPTYCFPNGQDMRRPDVLLVWPHRLLGGLTHDELFIPPDFVAEAVAPSNTWYGVRDRVEAYLGAGVPLVWVVEPDQRSVHAYRRDGTVTLYRSTNVIKDEPLLPGFEARVADFFPPVPAPGAPQ